MIVLSDKFCQKLGSNKHNQNVLLLFGKLNPQYRMLYVHVLTVLEVKAVSLPLQSTKRFCTGQIPNTESSKLPSNKKIYSSLSLLDIMHTFWSMVLYNINDLFK